MRIQLRLSYTLKLTKCFYFVSFSSVVYASVVANLCFCPSVSDSVSVSLCISFDLFVYVNLFVYARILNATGTYIITKCNGFRGPFISSSLSVIMLTRRMQSDRFQVSLWWGISGRR